MCDVCFFSQLCKDSYKHCMEDIYVAYYVLSGKLVMVRAVCFT